MTLNNHLAPGLDDAVEPDEDWCDSRVRPFNLDNNLGISPTCLESVTSIKTIRITNNIIRLFTKLRN